MKNDGPKVIGYRVDAMLDFAVRKQFKFRRAAEKYLLAIEARLKEANKICDGEIWTNIEVIYETRWDCLTARPAAAIFNFNNFGK